LPFFKFAKDLLTSLVSWLSTLLLVHIHIALETKVVRTVIAGLQQLACVAGTVQHREVEVPQ
jgi:hypothetical protein